MPESKSRRKDEFTPPPTRGERKVAKIGSAAWVAPVMVALFILGLLWIVTFYIAGTSVPFMNSVGGSYNALINVGIGFAFIAGGFILATRWK